MLTNLLRNRTLLVEIFAFGNLAFLALDIYMAHLVNGFSNNAEWIPLVLSLVSPPLLLGGYLFSRGDVTRGLSRTVGLCVGFASVLVGIAGLVLHLKSQFFLDFTIRSLVYTAPFVAPLSYTGVGFLFLLNRMLPNEDNEWSRWVIVLSLGGFVGKFILSLLDHAQNGFFSFAEWVPVAAAAFAIGFLLVLIVNPNGRTFQKQCLWLMLLQMLVGLTGFGLHLRGNLMGVSENLQDNFIHGAPIFAPLLFVNLALLAVIGIVELMARSEPV